jgi:DNA-binding response OmpR family regulator
MIRAQIRALLVTPDPVLVKHFISVCTELGIETQESAMKDGFPEELGRAKYEAVLLDFDNLPDTISIMAVLRDSPANRNALVFAVGSDISHRHQALRQGANFIFERPLDVNEIRRVVYNAYDLMARERRRYFRCAAELPALVSGAASGDLKCTTTNISSNGIALRTPRPLEPGELVQIALFLPGAGDAIHANGTVVWDDQHGKTAVTFQCDIPRDQSELDAWLNARFYELLTPRAANF